MKVKWLNETSDQFAVSNGVKQGTVQSPVLVCIYLDGLFTKLRSLDMDVTFSGALGYAYDVTLIAPSLQSLKQMIKIYEEYAKESDTQFNPSKSKLVCFNNKDSKEFTIP